VKIVDRKKNIFKLAIGEYIAAEKIENVYSRHKLIAEAFIYGNSLSHYLVGIFVVNEAPMLAFAKELNVNGTIDEVVKNAEVVKKFIEDINKKAKAEKL